MNSKNRSVNERIDNNASTKLILNTPDWKSVRSIYQKLSLEFHVLTTPYDVKLDDDTKLMLDHLILAIDSVDQSVDEIIERHERQDLMDSIIQFLINPNERWTHKLASSILEERIMTLKAIVKYLKVDERFHKAVSNIFKHTEEKRHVEYEAKLIELVMKEGVATSELPLSIMKINESHPFAKCFITLCTLMGIADLIVDARSDYRSNYIAVKPSISLYLNLHWILIKNGLSLIWHFPKKISFLLYCIRFSFYLLFSRD
jgi:hypothetical protein